MMTTSANDNQLTPQLDRKQLQQVALVPCRLKTRCKLYPSFDLKYLQYLKYLSMMRIRTKDDNQAVPMMTSSTARWKQLQMGRQETAATTCSGSFYLSTSPLTKSTGVKTRKYITIVLKQAQQFCFVTLHITVTTFDMVKHHNIALLHFFSVLVLE